MKQLLQKLKKNWIRVWLIAIAIVCSSFVGIAAYTEVSSVKRVVSTADTSGDPFSSNCMKAEVIDYHRMTSETTRFPVYVCNYDQNAPEKYCSTEINYILTAKLQVKVNNQYKDMSEIQTALDALPMNEDDRTAEQQAMYLLYSDYVAEAAHYSIQKTADDKNEGRDSAANTFNTENNYSVSYGTNANPEKLREQRSSSDVYTVTISSIDTNDEGDPLFFVYVEAAGITGANYTLKGRLYRTADRTEVEADWKGEISDQYYTSQNYDFFNYVITGSGQGTLDILWDESNIYINKFFLLENGFIDDLDDEIDPISGNDPVYGTQPADNASEEVKKQWIAERTGWKKITLNVDSTNKNRYELQLYKAVEGANIDPSAYIECHFTPEDQSQQQGG